MISPFRIVCRIHLPVCLVWLFFVKYTSIYCSVRGIKVPCICGEKNQSGYKTLFENIALQLFSLPLNCIFLFLQLEVVILDLVPENSFVKKGRISLSLTEILAFNKNKSQWSG